MTSAAEWESVPMKSVSLKLGAQGLTPARGPWSLAEEPSITGDERALPFEIAAASTT